MEHIKEFIESIKAFIWDVIGYMIPGIFIILILSICVENDFIIEFKLLDNSISTKALIFTISAYILGHVIFGFGEMLDRNLSLHLKEIGSNERFRWLKKTRNFVLKLLDYILGGYTKFKQIENKIENNHEGKGKAYLLCKKIIEKKIVDKGLETSIDYSGVRNLRNLVMSFIPESDNKVYTFMFRSELAKHVGNTSLILGLCGWLNYIFQKHSINIFRFEIKYLIIYTLLIVSYYLLKQTRDRFYAISINIPFSIYASKQLL